MPSHLTRQVFRRILANEPIIHRGCLRRQRYSSFARIPKVRRSIAVAGTNGLLQDARFEHRRSMINFNIFRKQQDVKEASMDPGIEKMMELAKRQRMSARLPPPEDIAGALRKLFRHKQIGPQRIEDNQAQLALRSLNYCVTAQQDLQDSGVGVEPYLTQDLLHSIAIVLNTASPERSTSDHMELAKAVYEAPKPSKNKNAVVRSALRAYVKTLMYTGSPEKALDLVLDYEKQIGISPKSWARADDLEKVEEEEDPEGENDIKDPDRRGLLFMWPDVLRGFALQGNESEVQRVLGLIQERSFLRFSALATIMLEFHMTAGNDVQAIKHWWAENRRSSLFTKKLNLRTLRYQAKLLQRLLSWCLDNSEIETGQEVVRDVMSSNPPKLLWDPIFVWAAGTKKSVDEIDRMMSVMEKSNEAITDRTEWRMPDIATINGLVEFAISRDDPYMAERFITLGKERNIEPDAKTFVLQMDYRLSVEDVDGALIAYKNLQSKDVSGNEDVPTVNRLIVALCKTNRHDFDTVMNVAADLSDRQVRFDARTVATLSLLHLSRDEHHDVIDLLNTHAFHYSSTERDSIRKALIDFCLDTKTPTARAWLNYDILKDVFDEMPRAERTELMTSFLQRERADMAVRIFQNMRMHSRLDTIPSIETYVTAFIGLAKLKDLDSVEVVHNLLKLDFNINVSTYLNNALIIAYTACSEARHALDFWEDIVASKEGPTYNSIHIALRACEKAAFGDLRAKDIWTMLRRRGIELDTPLWASYVAALVGNGNIGQGIEALEEAEGKDEVEVDYFVLGSLFNAAQQQMKGGEVKAWGQERYPEQWEKLESFGVDIEEQWIQDVKVHGILRGYRIDRRVGP